MSRATAPSAPLPKIILWQTHVDTCASGAAMLPLEQTCYATMV